MRMINIWTIAMLALLVSFPKATADSVISPEPDWPSAPTTPVDRAHVEALIDQLTSISEEGVGFDTGANASVFPPTETVPKFEGGILGTLAPSTSPVVKKLVSLGVPALPQLIEHLTDGRATKLTIKHPTGMGAMWHGAEFDARSHDRVFNPAGTVMVNGSVGDVERDHYIDTYTVTVGDVCYVVVGQIVNRHYNAIRYQMTACQVVNSPTHTPALADAVKSAWSGVTCEELRQSLILDAELGGQDAGPAIQRLCYYFPHDGEALAIKLLNRPIVNWETGMQFFENISKEEPILTWSDILHADRIRSVLEHPKNRLTKLVAAEIDDGTTYQMPLGKSGDDTWGLTERLNHVLSLGVDYSPADFADVSLRRDTRRELAEAKDGYDRMHANRKLLEDLFPGCLFYVNDHPGAAKLWQSRLSDFIEKNGAPYGPFLCRSLLNEMDRQRGNRNGASLRWNCEYCFLMPTSTILGS